MMSPEIQVVEFTEIVGELEPPCEYAEALPGFRSRCPGTPARWVLFVKDHGCGSYVRLACTHCKDIRMNNHISTQCDRCGHITIDACEAYSRIEAL